MRIAVIGSGGREHALLWKLAQDSGVTKLFALPGNGGTNRLAESIAVKVDDREQLRRAVIGLKPDLVVVGPEIPLAQGIADMLRSDNIPCFGPSAAAARIEASKVFAKQLMQRHNVPTAEFEIFASFEELQQYVTSVPQQSGWVVKADGLAAGKGAVVCKSIDEVLAAARAMLVEGMLGSAGKQVVLERRLVGCEASTLFWCDGEHFAALPVAQDYKRAHDGDQGPNTGGMGSVCPARHVTDNMKERIAKDIIGPTLRALANEGCPFKGVLYAGLMITDDGPQVIEYNCRFGDPETQVILPVWTGSIVETMLQCVEGNLQPDSTPFQTNACAVCVVLAADGYPGSYSKHLKLRSFPDREDAVTFHAGTSVINGELVSAGGRVLNAVGVGADFAAARASA